MLPAATHPQMIHSNCCLCVFECFRYFGATRATCGIDSRSRPAKQLSILIFRIRTDGDGDNLKSQATLHSHTVKPEHHFSAEMNARVECQRRALRRARRPFDPPAALGILRRNKDAKGDVQGVHINRSTIEGTPRTVTRNVDRFQTRGECSEFRNGASPIAQVQVQKQIPCSAQDLDHTV